MKTKLTSLLLACGAVAASPFISSAQDGRPQQETVKPAEPTLKPRPDGDAKRDGDRPREADRPRDGERKHDGADKREDGRKHDGGRPPHGGDKRDEHRAHPKPPESKPVTYLGLAMNGLSPEVAAQAGLQEGFGLLVTGIMDGSPAKAAGFEKYDVLVMIGDQRIVNMQQFQTLVRAQKKGDEVTVTIRRKGVETKVSAMLGEHTFPATAGHGHHPMLPPGARGDGPGPRFFNHNLPDPRARAGEIKERMEHMREMVRERFQNRGSADGRSGPVFPRPGPIPMNRDGDRKGPHPAPPHAPQSMHREGDRGPAGPQGSGPRPNVEMHRDGNRPGGDHGSAGPQNDGPRRNAEAPRDGNRPGGDRGKVGPQAGGPRPNPEAHRDGNRPGDDRGKVGPQAGGPRPNPEARRDGNRPDGEQGGRGPRSDGPPANGPRAGGPPDSGPRPDQGGAPGGPRPDAPRP